MERATNHKTPLMMYLNPRLVYRYPANFAGDFITDKQYTFFCLQTIS